MPTFTVESTGPPNDASEFVTHLDVVTAADPAAAQALIEARYQPPAVTVSQVTEHVGVPAS
jgi:hypothetical protein